MSDNQNGYGQEAMKGREWTETRNLIEKHETYSLKKAMTIWAPDKVGLLWILEKKIVDGKRLGRKKIRERVGKRERKLFEYICDGLQRLKTNLVESRLGLCELKQVFTCNFTMTAELHCRLPSGKEENEEEGRSISIRV